MRAAGFFRDPANIEHVKYDPDLDALGGRGDFQKLTAWDKDRGGGEMLEDTRTGEM